MFKQLLLTSVLVLGFSGNANAISVSNTTCKVSDGLVTTYLNASHFDAWYFEKMYASVKSADGVWHDSEFQEVAITQSNEYTFEVSGGYDYQSAAIYVIDRNGHQSYLDTIICKS